MKNAETLATLVSVGQVFVPNIEVGIAARITKMSRGYAVAIVDTDEGETLPELRIFPGAEAAVEFAHKAAGVA